MADKKRQVVALDGRIKRAQSDVAELSADIARLGRQRVGRKRRSSGGSGRSTRSRRRAGLCRSSSRRRSCRAGRAAPPSRDAGHGGRSADSRVSCDIRGAGREERTRSEARQSELTSLRAEAEERAGRGRPRGGDAPGPAGQGQGRARLPRTHRRRAVRGDPAARGVHPGPAGEAAPGGGAGRCRREAAAAKAPPRRRPRFGGTAADRRPRGLRASRPARVAGRRPGRRGLRGPGPPPVRDQDVPERD